MVGGEINRERGVSAVACGRRAPSTGGRDMPTQQPEPAPAFDPARYKDTTREQWQQAAEAWHRWGPTLEEWLGEATTVMLDLAGVGVGARVLDVAAGAGGQTL